MQGAIIGDTIGSVYEWDRIKTKSFPLFTDGCFFTDDSIMTIAVGIALMSSKESGYRDLSEKAIYWMRKGGSLYPYAGWGGSFSYWLSAEDPKPYNSWGNGSAMRVSPCGIVGESIGEVKMLSAKVTEISHNHPEGMKGAEAAAVAVWMARNGKTKEEIRNEMEKYYDLDFTIDEIRDDYKFDESCMYTVPQAIMCFLEADSYEDTVRNAVSLGGDSDTLAAIAGSIAAEHFGIPKAIREKGLSYLDDRLSYFVASFEEKYPPKIV